MSACEKGNQWQRALALLSEMWEAKLEPDVTFTPLTLPVTPLREVQQLHRGKSAGPDAPSCTPRRSQKAQWSLLRSTS
eukprot:3572324-Pyramimonas_sp.AAC.1